MTEYQRVLHRVASLGAGDRVRLVRRMGLDLTYPACSNLLQITDAVMASGRTVDFFVYADEVSK